MNRLRLWFSRNGFKILIICVSIIIVYIFIKSWNQEYKENIESKQPLSQTEQNSQENENVFNASDKQELIQNTNLELLENTSVPYEKVSSVVNKMLNTIYEAGLVSDNTQLRQDIYHMFSDELIEKASNIEGYTFDVNSVLNFVFSVDDLERYSIENIYRIQEKGNVGRYLVELRYSDFYQTSLISYLVINMDYNQNTFSYDGNFSSPEEITKHKEIDSIENKGSNTF